MLKKIETGFSSIHCAKCQVKCDMSDFVAGGGQCGCGSQTFDVTVRVRKHFRYDDDSPGGRGEVPALSMASFIPVIGDVAEIAGELNKNDHVTRSTENREYDLSNLTGETVAALARSTAEQVVKFISEIRKVAARANLREGQGVCRECESVYTIAHAGFAAEGYCSKICKSKYEREHPETAPPAPPKVSVIHCPKCGKSTKLRPGKTNVCMWCGTGID